MMRRYGHGLLMLLVALVGVALIASPALAASPNAGATLQGSKTIEICDNGDGTWHYSGAISVWNTGANDATQCLVNDKIETKNVSGPNWTKACDALINASCGNLNAIVPGGTLSDSAFVTTYACDAPAATTTVRNNANITIANHSGGRANGPNPKATYLGPVPPESCNSELPCHCSLTQGYYKNHTDDAAWSAADLSVFDVFIDVNPQDGIDDDNGSGADEALAILNANGGNTPAFGPWYIVAKQYIAYLLNAANGSCTPEGLAPTVTTVANFFASHKDPAACAPITGKGGNPNPCNAPVDAACILDVYNHGEYPEGPLHCDEADPSDKICAGIPTP